MSILKILWKIFLVLLITGIGAAITCGGNLLFGNYIMDIGDNLLLLVWGIEILIILIYGIRFLFFSTNSGNLKITTIVLTILLICGLIFVAYFF